MHSSPLHAEVTKCKLEEKGANRADMKPEDFLTQTDYVKTGNNIKLRFEEWLKRDEFETTVAYQARLYTESSRTFRQICFEEIHRAGRHVGFRVFLQPYNADEEFFLVELRKKVGEQQGYKVIERWEVKGSSRLKIPLSKAKDFRFHHGGGTDGQELTNTDWTLVGHSFVPTKHDYPSQDNSSTVNFTINNAAPIIYSTTSLKIQHPHLDPITFHYDRHAEEIDRTVINEVSQRESPNQIFTSVQVQPEPPGGMAAFRKWITDNFQYPQGAIDAGVKGAIELTFVVERDGSLTDIQIKRDLGHGTGQAGINLLKKARRWSPGIQNGRPVRVQYSLPIRIDLSQ